MYSFIHGWLIALAVVYQVLPRKRYHSQLTRIVSKEKNMSAMEYKCAAAKAKDDVLQQIDAIINDPCQYDPL